jgi:pSer/pThr/pTyr-binding forkhead associated (FHA) protein
VTPEEMSNLDTAVSKNDGSGHGKKTQYVPPEAMKAQAASVQASVLPPLSGFLVTYSWDTAGLWFPVREGKNTYGSGKSCDGVVHQDRALSGEHFAIMCRNGEIRVRDLASTNATVVDGNEVWGETVVATHGSNIRAGDTTFVLVLIPGRNAQKKGEQP